MKKLLGVVLIVVGAFLLIQGFNRKDSLVGEASETGTKIANSVDGGTRMPKHMGYIIGGGVLVLVGGALALSRSRVAV
ncbi:MAG: DUF3185 family protein [Opitutaceae bacterium]|nr:DUF3185 family protein [Opitutaceae bacterium]